MWYGPLLPYCTLQAGVAYIAHQKTRFSDQFFILPRNLAGWVMNMADDFRHSGKVLCFKESRKNSSETEPTNRVIAMLRPENHGFSFERNFFEMLTKHAKKERVEIKMMHYPRILSRENVVNEGESLIGDAKSKVINLLQLFFT